MKLRAATRIILTALIIMVLAVPSAGAGPTKAPAQVSKFAVSSTCVLKATGVYSKVAGAAFVDMTFIDREMTGPGAYTYEYAYSAMTPAPRTSGRLTWSFPATVTTTGDHYMFARFRVFASDQTTVLQTAFAPMDAFGGTLPTASACEITET